MTDRYATVPERLLRSDASDRAVRLYCILQRRDAGQGIYVRRRTLARDLNCSLRSVDGALNELERLGWLRVIPRVRLDSGEVVYAGDFRDSYAGAQAEYMPSEYELLQPVPRAAQREERGAPEAARGSAKNDPTPCNFIPQVGTEVAPLKEIPPERTHLSTPPPRARGASEPEPESDRDLAAALDAELRADAGDAVLLGAVAADLRGGLAAAGLEFPGPGWCLGLLRRGLAVADPEAIRRDIDAALDRAQQHQAGAEYVRGTLEGRIAERERGLDPDAKRQHARASMGDPPWTDGGSHGPPQPFPRREGHPDPLEQPEWLNPPRLMGGRPPLDGVDDLAAGLEDGGAL